MPRKRGSKKGKKQENKPKVQKLKVKPSSKKEFPLEEYALGLLEGFMRAEGDIIAVAYRLQTAQIGNEDIMREYKSRAIEAVTKLARSRGLTMSVQHIHFKAMPVGNETLIKAYANKADSIESRSRRRQESNDPFFGNIEV